MRINDAIVFVSDVSNAVPSCRDVAGVPEISIGEERTRQ
jgi:hypothetical protein